MSEIVKPSGFTPIKPESLPSIPVSKRPMFLRRVNALTGLIGDKLDDTKRFTPIELEDFPEIPGAS